MTVAYMILAHQVNEQLKLQIETLLEDQRSFVYLHLDRKCRDLSWLSGFAHARFVLVPRVLVNWGGYSVVRASKELLGAAYENERNSRFVFLSGTCFPLRRTSVLNDILLSGGSIFSLWHAIDKSTKGRPRRVVTKPHFYDVAALNPARSKLRRYAWRAFRFLAAITPYERRLPPEPLWRGSQFFVADRDLAGELIGYHPGLERLLKYASAPDEIYFCTLYGRAFARHGQAIPVVSKFDERQGSHFIRRRPQRSLLDRTGTVDLRKLDRGDVQNALRSGALFARKCDLDVCRAVRAAHDAPEAEGNSAGSEPRGLSLAGAHD